ncbi:MAG: ribonuclease R [Bacteroidaceae bacterium]|nr:ribonuclease R [Bacteroidaceae bacterium]
MTKPKGKKAGKSMNKSKLISLLMDLFQKRPGEDMSLRYIFSELRLTTHPLKMLCTDILYEMVEDAYLCKLENHHYRLNSSTASSESLIEGVFRRKRNGSHLFEPADGSESVPVAERNSLHAMNGDRVEVAYFTERAGKEVEGEVVRITERADGHFIGTLDVTKSFAFLQTENRTLSNDIFIPREKLKGGKTGDKAVVRILEWPENAKNPLGEVIDILGASGDNTTEMHAILAEYGLPYKYPAAVEAAAEAISDVITPEEIKDREDFRKITTFTIDPKDAKDFDDALSIRRLDEDTWEIGVHIADVTHYVKEGDIIDQEAAKRATSVYLVDRTIPMLPERLCNQICSLRPNEEKMAYSAIFDIDNAGEVKKSRIVHTVINSDRRFTYEEAQEIIETGKGDFAEEVLKLNELAQIIRQKRFDAGAISFERAEMRFEIDENGKPLGVYLKESKEANKLVEEFMLLANRTVAESVGKPGRGRKPKVFPYRIHDLPDPEKLENLSHFIARFGYKIRTTGDKLAISKSINQLLAQVKGAKEEALVSTISIRSMQKARYTVNNVGHYGLAFDFYTHFTSPIRRYPDMLVHRLLTKYKNGGKSVAADKYEELCEHSSSMEQIAANAERSSIKYKQVEYMQSRLGEVYEGVISGITEWGLYVEINENKCEGMIPIRNLDDDYYAFEEKNYCLRGRSKNRVYGLGDPITIRVASANLEKRQLDFALAEKPKK